MNEEQLGFVTAGRAAASRPRSRRLSRGRFTCRWSTFTWCRSTRSSMSFSSARRPPTPRRRWIRKYRSENSMELLPAEENACYRCSRLRIAEVEPFTAEHGLAAELWSISGLARFVAEHAEAAGFPRLAHAGKSTVWRILDEVDIKPHKIAYYLERRDPDFDRKMHEVLMVYRDVSIHAEGAVDEDRPDPIYTVSVDEKPGVQALGLTAPDLPPVPGKARAFGRDYEYVRHGTVSILAGIDLHSGHIFASVEDRHRSLEFIGLLARLDAYYPPEAVIRVVLDNHSAHIS